MTEPNPESPKAPNLVRKVFDRPSGHSDKLSPLFTYFKHSQKIAPAKEHHKSGLDARLPAAVDFGSSRIKLIKFSRDSKGDLEIVAMDEQAYEASSAADSLSLQKKALEKLLGRNSIGHEVIAGLGPKEVLSYNFTFPVMSDAELDEAIRWKLKPLRPHDRDPENLRYTFVKWDSSLQGMPEAAQQRVTVFCVTLESIALKKSLLAAFGLKAVSVQIPEAALVHLRRLKTTAAPADDVTLWLDLGADQTTFVIDKAGATSFMRVLPLSSRQLTRQISQSLKVPESEAEDLKRRHGLEAWSANKPAVSEPSSDNPAAERIKAVSSAMLSLLENLVVDIEHSFKHFSYQVCQSQIVKFDRVLLTGGGANLRNLEVFLSDRLGVPVETVNPYTALRVGSAIRSQRKELPYDATVFASAAAMVVAHLTERPKRVNLLFGEEKSRLQRLMTDLQKKPAHAAAVAVAALVLLMGPQIVISVLTKNEAKLFSEKLKRAKADLGDLQTSQLRLAEEEKALTDKKAMLEERLEVLEKSLRGDRSTSKILSKVAALLPEEIWVNKLTYADPKLTINGSTSDNELVVSFLDNLKKPSDFTDVTFHYTQKDPKSSVYSFEIGVIVR